MRNNGDRNRFISRETSNSTTYVTGNHLGSLWFIEADNQNNHPYLLDWYYTSRPRDASTSRDVPTDPFDETHQHRSRDWMPSNLTHNEPEYEEYINEYHNDRAASHLGASISAPIFRESIIHDQDSNDLHRRPTRSHWWARSHQQGEHGQTSFFEPPEFNQAFSRGEHGQTSFFEPPEFNHQRAHNYNDKLSDIGSENEDREQQLYLRNSIYHHKLSHTVHIDEDLESGEFNLHFDDVYSRPPDNPTVNPNNSIF